MGDLVKDRDLKDSEKKTDSEKEEENKFKKTGRNEKCPCGSGKKFKHCHGNL